MVRVIMGPSGMGKSKQVIDMVNAAVKTEHGNVVCIERAPKLTLDLNSSVRLIETSDYTIKGFDGLKGFLCGIYASNYDITHVFVDSLCKLVPSDANDPEVSRFLDWLNGFGETNGIKFTLTITGDTDGISDGVSKYF
jgi:hypothetical protein